MSGLGSILFMLIRRAQATPQLLAIASPAY